VNRSGIAAELAAVKRVPINRAEAIQAESASSPRKRAASADFVSQLREDHSGQLCQAQAGQFDDYGRRPVPPTVGKFSLRKERSPTPAQIATPPRRRLGHRSKRQETMH